MCRERGKRANRTAYSLSFVVYDKLVDAGELSLDRFVVTVMGLAKVLEGGASMRPTKERFNIIVREAEDVTPGDLVSTVRKDMR